MAMWLTATASTLSLVAPSTQPGGSTPMPGGCEGSLLGLVSVLQESSHVQQSILYSAGKPGGMGLLTAVEGSDCDVDVISHWVVTHSVAIWHHRTKAHCTVCLRTNLTGQEVVMLSHSIGSIHEHLRHRSQVYNTLHLQPKEMSFNGLPMNCFGRILPVSL